MKITDQIFKEYLNCKYKSNLMINDQFQALTEYESFLARQQHEYEIAAASDLLALPEKLSAFEKTRIDQSTLKQGLPTIIAPQVINKSFDFSFHALQKIPGASSLGTFYYLPVIFCGETMREAHKLLLSFGGFILEQLQGFRPPEGIAIYGNALKGRKIDVDSCLYRTQAILKDLKEYSACEAKPRLRLNDHCRICRYKLRCITAAKQSDDLSLLNRISEREIENYNRKGIFTVTQLSHTFRFRKRGKRVKAQGRPHSFALQALALREKCVFLVNRPTIETGHPHIFVDMEGCPTSSFVYLIGMIIIEDGIHEYRFFWADHKGDEEQMFRCFVECLSGFQKAKIFYYGSYEARVFRRILCLSSTEHVSSLLLEESTNVLSLIYANIYFPTYSNELKAIGNYLGFKWSRPEANGIQAHLWRKRWEDGHAPPLKDALVVYNKQDCLALEKLVTFLAILPNVEEEKDRAQRGVRFVDNIVPDRDDRRWGKCDHIVKDFDLVVKCAYFDYQRNKVYIRTNKNFKRINRHKKRDEKRQQLRPNKRSENRTRSCPHCGYPKIHIDRRKFRSKLNLDLKFSAGGVKRWVTCYYTPRYWCYGCERSFAPPSYSEKQKYGHGLISWSVDQHVANRLTFEHLERTCKDSFGLSVPFTHFHNFKAYAARYYTITYNRILRKLIKGPIIHADETKINLQKGSGYVWIFTNMEEVIYLYRPGREAGFLHELLDGFKGTLITDFYTGYDSLPFRQQKCLIHLIRDLNDDLRKNPFNQEFLELGTRFGSLLRSIIETVDRFGLKCRNLRKHEREAERFRDRLEGEMFDSNVAKKYQKRLLKYHKKLFAFLDQDGIPWNNNNAEHAVKHFAKYRRVMNGRMTEKGLTDYLILLSLYQTCRYKELNFLKFLLSKERDIDRFFRKT